MCVTFLHNFGQGLRWVALIVYGHHVCGASHLKPDVLYRSASQSSDVVPRIRAALPIFLQLLRQVAGVLLYANCLLDFWVPVSAYSVQIR